MHPTPTVGRPPGQRGRKPGRRKTKVTGPWSQKGSALGPQSIQPGKGLEPIKVPKKRGPKPGSKVGMKWFRERFSHLHLTVLSRADSFGFIFPGFAISMLQISASSLRHWRWKLDCFFVSKETMSVDYYQHVHHRQNYIHLHCIGVSVGNLSGILCQNHRTPHRTTVSTWQNTIGVNYDWLISVSKWMFICVTNSILLLTPDEHSAQVVSQALDACKHFLPWPWGALSL